MSSTTKPVPRPDQYVGLRALRGIWQRHSIIGALEVMHAEMGDIFRLTVPGFNPIMLAGPEAGRFIMITSRDDLRWHMPREPITILLRHGVLVEDGESHDRIRRAMSPALHKRMLSGYVDTMVRRADQVMAGWQPDSVLNMLVEMRRVALLILTDTLFGIDFTPDMQRLWPGVLRAVRYISPGPWVLWRGFSRWGYDRNLRLIDDYLFRIIAHRRAHLRPDAEDMLSLLIEAGMDDDLIRDQLMTMLIAGHDTSTATLTWVLYLLGAHPQTLPRVYEEVDSVLNGVSPAPEHLNDLGYLGQVIDETLRLYPPIHLGSRFAAQDLEFNGYHIPAGHRVLYSIYLTHRHPDHWPEPARFNPDRFAPGIRHTPYTYVPFGGGPRNCMGAAFAQVESKVVLARILQRFSIQLVSDNVYPHMGATLEPGPSVMMRISRR